MPLSARSITPVDIAAKRLPPGVEGDDLECIANGTMANLMRQMSSLGLHAVQIFGNLQKELSSHDRRIERIHDRIARLQENLANPPPPSQTNSSELDGKRKAFKSELIIDQHTLDRSTMPPAMLELYNQCEDPPNLNLLNPYRDDTQSALKLYTNPDYFFDLWKEEMLKEDPLETRKPPRAAKSPERNGSPSKKRKQRTSTSATRQQQNAPIQSNVVLGHYRNAMHQQQQNNPQEFMHFPSEYQAPELLRNPASHGNENYMPPPPGMSMPVQPTRIAPGRPQASSHNPQQQQREMVTEFQGLNLMHSKDLGLLEDEDDDLPPPPPPLSDHTSLLHNISSPSAYSSASTMPVVLPQSPMKLIEAPLPPPMAVPEDDDILPPPPSIQLTSTVSSTAPPPPPPPPPPPALSMMTSSTIQATSFGGNAITGGPTVKEEGKPDRGNLLAEIQAGMKLKKIQIQKEKQEEKAAIEKNDVAAILRQRMKKVASSISDDEDEEEDDGEWD